MNSAENGESYIKGRENLISQDPDQIKKVGKGV
jgi:hypothetical protein